MPKQTFFNLPEVKKQKIIDLALEEFSNYSYDKASLSRIVTKAEIAKGSMYQYFVNKRDLYMYLLEMAAQEKLAYIQKRMDFRGDFFTSLKNAILVSTKFNLENPQLVRIIVNAMGPGTEGMLQELVVKSKELTLQFFQQMMEQSLQQGKVRSDVDFRLVAHLLYGILGVGLSDYLLELLGVDVRDLLLEPKLAKNLSEEKIRQTTDMVVAILKSGLEAKE